MHFCGCFGGTSKDHLPRDVASEPPLSLRTPSGREYAQQAKKDEAHPTLARAPKAADTAEDVPHAETAVAVARKPAAVQDASVAKTIHATDSARPKESKDMGQSSSSGVSTSEHAADASGKQPSGTDLPGTLVSTRPSFVSPRNWSVDSELISSTPSSGGFEVISPDHLIKEVQQLVWIGYGGYGSVYKGIWQRATVAVKYTTLSSVDMQRATSHEATLSKMLSHPNVVTTFASRVALLDEEFLSRVMIDAKMYSSSSKNTSTNQDFMSGEGFGNPYTTVAGTVHTPADVLLHIAAKPGNYLTAMIMEYCDRGSLYQAIVKGVFRGNSQWNSKVAMRALLRTAREVAMGMHHLHSARVIHGDLKPGNVLLVSSRLDRRGFVAKVSDFGLSTYCLDSHISVSRWSTVGYMAPEAFNGSVHFASDIWSFGVLLWEMCTGRQPHAGLQPAQIVMGISNNKLHLVWPPGSDPRLINLVDACCNRDPSKRPDFAKLTEDLSAIEAMIRLEAAGGGLAPGSPITSPGSGYRALAGGIRDGHGAANPAARAAGRSLDGGLGRRAGGADVNGAAAAAAVAAAAAAAAPAGAQHAGVADASQVQLNM